MTARFSNGSRRPSRRYFTFPALRVSESPPCSRRILLPRLREDGWKVVEARLFLDPIEQIRTAVLNAEGPFARNLSANLSLRDLLINAAGALARRDGTPFLLVIDQFEEFLILNREHEQANFTTFLVDLSQNPINGVKLLLVFRSEYTPLLFKLKLPPLVAGRNWHELAAYDRHEATALLRGSGAEVSAQAIDALFRGLDGLEETPGRYRLSTLNMIGLILNSMVGTLQGDPSKLMQTYLTEILTGSEVRDFVKPLFAAMITAGGSRALVTTAELADKTHFATWEVNATLADLARRGLVRRLSVGNEGAWELSHDFLARTISKLLKPTVMERVRPVVAPGALLGWAIMVALVSNATAVLGVTAAIVGAVGFIFTVLGYYFYRRRTTIILLLGDDVIKIVGDVTEKDAERIIHSIGSEKHLAIIKSGDANER